MIRRPPRSTLDRSSAASDVYKRQDYDVLISTMPLDLLLGSLRDVADLSAYIPSFVHSSSHIVGVGIKGRLPEDLTTKCWIYFPEAEMPCYRATVFSNYS